MTTYNPKFGKIADSSTALAGLAIDNLIRSGNLTTHAGGVHSITAATFQGSHVSSGNVTLNLPTPAEAMGKTARFTRVGGNSINVSAPANTLRYAGQTYTSVSPAVDNESVEIYSDGTFFYITNTLFVTALA
jgi:hypothetical protein